MPGTALQRSAFATASTNVMFRALSVSLSLAITAEGRAGVCPVAQKTVTNADIIALDYLCPGEFTNIAALVIKIDPAEKTSDLRALSDTIRFFRALFYFWAPRIDRTLLRH
jgi:hypothetical protein